MKTAVYLPTLKDLVRFHPHTERVIKSNPLSHPIPILGSKRVAIDGMHVDHREFGGDFEPLFGMAGFTSYDDIINAISVSGFRQMPIMSKSSLGATVAARSYDLWQAAGMPPAGAFGTALTGRAASNADAAAIPFTDPGGGRFAHLLTGGIGSTAALGTIFLYDRLVEYPFTGTVTSGSFTAPTIPSRDVAGAALGAGIQMFLENWSATATAAVTVTPTYTNSAGTGSKTNAFASLVTGAVAGELANPASRLWLALASGDTGVRSIQSYTLSASILAANMMLVLARPLAVIPMLSGNAYVERDMVMQLANMPRLYAGTAMAMLLVANTTSSPLIGHLVTSEN